MNDNEIYISRHWNYEEERNGKYLLIWSDMPKWLVADYELFLFLKLLNGENNIGYVVRKLSDLFNKNFSKTKEEIDQISKWLVDSGIIYKKGEKVIISLPPEKKIDSVNINVTTKCNLHCKMCFNKFHNVSSEKELKIEEIQCFLDEVKDFSEEYGIVNISGGEPLICADKTLSIVEYAKNLGFKTVWIITNGTLVTPAFAKKAKELDVKIVVSIDGSCEEEHDFIRGKGVFKKAISGIKTLKKEGIFVIMNFMVHMGNYKSLGGYFELAESLGVDQARFIPLKKIGGGLEDVLEVVPKPLMLKTAYELLVKNPKHHKLMGTDYFTQFSVQCRLSVKQGWCGCGKFIVLLDVDGSIYPCPGHILPEFNAGNIREQSFSDIWENAPILIKLREIYDVDNINDQCSKCNVRHWCLGCRGETFHVTHKMDAPIIDCEDIKKSIFDMFWILADNPEIGMGKLHIAH